ncbi:hypothetical protein BSL78_24583 [Apostichopus japonicus]|uniref:Uncharacterized protein n=1 Tax=Stichopus japonicus TaxID=307972 RepID=A0A2G8JSB3_STIJA|nr:hypothetical protein BSL78_24583 [Apostichopus japonicus]
MLVKVLSNLSEGKEQLSRPTNKSAVERCKIYTLTVGYHNAIRKSFQTNTCLVPTTSRETFGLEEGILYLALLWPHIRYDDGLAGEYIPAHIHPIPRRLPNYGPIQEDSHVTVSSEMKKPASRVLSFPGEDEGTRAVPSTNSSSLIDTIFSGEPSSLTTGTRDESKRHQSQNTPGNEHHRNPSDHHEILPLANNSEEATKVQSHHTREL